MTRCNSCNLYAGQTKYYKDTEFAITDCPECEIPILIFAHHGNDRIPSDWYYHADDKLGELFGDRLLYTRTFPEHSRGHVVWHVYLREGEDEQVVF